MVVKGPRGLASPVGPGSLVSADSPGSLGGSVLDDCEVMQLQSLNDIQGDKEQKRPRILECPGKLGRWSRGDVVSKVTW